MAKSELTAGLLDLRGCIGRINSGKYGLDVVFNTAVDAHGKVTLVFDPLPASSDTRFLYDIFHHPGPTLEPFQLEATHPDGARLSTRAAYIVSISSQPDHTDLEATCYDLEVEFPSSPDQVPIENKVEYLVPGLKAFRVIEVNTPIGLFAVCGAKDPADSGAPYGVISIDTAIDATEEQELIDDQVSRLLDVLSLANGQLLQWSMRKRFSGSRGVAVHFRTTSSISDQPFPLFPSLHLHPAIETALNNYTPELRQDTGLDVAIAWSLMISRYSEADFLAAMTALEHLIGVYSDKNSLGGIIEKGSFKSTIRPCVEEALRRAFASLGIPSGDDRETKMLGKLDDLNRSLKVCTEAFLTDHGVPVDDLKAGIPQLVRLRNDIVHRGQASPKNQPHLERRLAVLQELLARVFLTLLRYHGPYCSYLHGYQIKQFPFDSTSP